ncbi:type VI secretion system protein TssA [Brenneria sp. g21c3]|uniref:type VI secretion system protein TssA n=1 Tax=Brenneria sp. g21c3 TaxID=3093893 RepID=UPI002EAD3DF3|nr:type VI secretion system protein TssA [Brenneria sp. g21c3]
MLQQLIISCFGQRDPLAETRKWVNGWHHWLQPIDSASPVGEDPAYDDDFQRMRDEVNKLSGIDTDLVCSLAETLLTTRCKDVRVATYYIWARLHRDGEAGLAQGLLLLAGLVATFGETLLPTRKNSRRLALEWLTGGKLQDSLYLYPEVTAADFEKIVGALALLDHLFADWKEENRPALQGLAATMHERLLRSGGAPSTARPAAESAASGESALQPAASQTMHSSPPPTQRIQSGRDLLDQARELSRYLRDQPQGWLSSARLMRSLRWDTLHQLPPQDASGHTRLMPPRSELRAQLKRLHQQQHWLELLEQTERMFAEGVNHFWLDLQWYTCQALSKSGHPYEQWGDIIKRDLGMFLERLPDLELQSYNDGTPFADEITRQWIDQHVQGNQAPIEPDLQASATQGDNDILSLESEAMVRVETEGIDAALAWLWQLPEIATQRQRWLQRLLMARVAEQGGRSDVALPLLNELNSAPQPLQLQHWEPELIFEVRARLLKMLRVKMQRSQGDKTALAQQIDALIAGLVAIDPVKAAMVCAQ